MTAPTSDSRRPLFLLMMGAMSIGLAPIFVRLAVEQGGVGSIAAGFWRMLIGGIAFALISMRSPAQYRILLTHTRQVFLRGKTLVAAAGLMFALDLTAWHLSFEYTSVANSTLIANLSSIFVPAAGVVFFAEPLRRSLFVGGTVAIGGVLMLVLFSQTPQTLIHADHSLWGDGLALLTAFFYTSYMLITKRLAGRFPARIQMLVVSLISALVLWVSSIGLSSTLIPTNPIGWLWILLLGFVSQALGQGLIAKALAELPVSKTALLLLAAPISTAVFGVMFLNQNLAVGQIAGMALTLIGIVVVASRK